MRKLILLMLLLFSTCLGNGANAQISVTFNIGQQPVWGLVGYDYVDYYYLPDIGVYYNVPTHQYTYWEDSKWVSTNGLPARYANFDLYAAHKVVINQTNEAWLNDNEYKNKYGQFAGKHDQVAIRDSHEEKYWENPDHPQHSKWHEQSK